MQACCTATSVVMYDARVVTVDVQHNEKNVAHLTHPVAIRSIEQQPCVPVLYVITVNGKPVVVHAINLKKK